MSKWEMRKSVSLKSYGTFQPSLPYCRGLHSTTFRLNVSAFFGIGGACRGFLGGVQEVSGGIGWCSGCDLGQERLKLS